MANSNKSRTPKNTVNAKGSNTPAKTGAPSAPVVATPKAATPPAAPTPVAAPAPRAKKGVSTTARSRTYCAGVVLAKMGLGLGVNAELVQALNAEYGVANNPESDGRLRNAHNVIRGFCTALGIDFTNPVQLQAVQAAAKASKGTK